MTDGQHKPDAPPSLVDLVGNVITTVAEIGWSLVAAGRGVLSVAARLVRLAQQQLRPEVGEPTLERSPCGESRTAVERPAPDALPARPPRTSSALALDEDIAPPAAPVAKESRPQAERTAAVAGAAPPTPELPSRYDRDRLVAVARDPENLFVWWEVTDATRSAAAPAPSAGAEEAAPTDALRIRALDAGEDRASAPATVVVPLPPFATSRYVQVPRARRRFEVALGVLRDGTFTPLLDPVLVETPPSAMTGDGEVRWRVAGKPSESAAAPEPARPLDAEGLWRQLSSTPLPASSEWAAGNRLLELEIGGSHDLPSS